MNVEQWRNNAGRDKKKDLEEAFLSLTSFITYSTSNRLVMSWVTVGRVSRLSCVVAMKRLKFLFLLAI
jgi:hypothetical protein